jgi:hypothetical protein
MPAALAALLAGPRANALPPTRLFQAAAATPVVETQPRERAEPYVRKDHSLRALCQVRATQHDTPAVACI